MALRGPCLLSVETSSSTRGSRGRKQREGGRDLKERGSVGMISVT